MHASSPALRLTAPVVAWQREHVPADAAGLHAFAASGPFQFWLPHWWTPLFRDLGAELLWASIFKAVRTGSTNQPRRRLAERAWPARSERMGPTHSGVGESRSASTKQRIKAVVLGHPRRQGSHGAGLPLGTADVGAGSFPGVPPFWTLGVLSHSLGTLYSVPGTPPILTTTGIPATAQCPLGAESPLDGTLL